MLVIFRKPKAGRLSIEKLFKPLAEEYKSFDLNQELTGFINFFKIYFQLLKIKESYIHVTGDVHYVITLLFWKRSILTIHDLNHYEELQGLRRKIYGILWFWLPLRLAQRIIVISPYTRKQLMIHFKVQKDKIHVIPNTFSKINKLEIKKNDQYFKILIVGTKKNKNIFRLIEAVKDFSSTKLIIVGHLSIELKKQLHHNLINFQHFFDISDDLLAQLYNEADMLYFASTKEGFGLPILEAQSIGVPVLTSTTTSMPFVSGKAAVLVDPYSVESIKKGIQKILYKEIDVLHLIQKGYENVKRFSEEQFILEYKRVYYELCQNSFK